MHSLIFGHSFAVLVAPILLFGLAFYFLNKKKTSARRNAEDVDTGASGSTTTDANFGGSSLSPTETDNDASSSLTASTGSCYEVFLSFRGPDTRHGFTDHLYTGLLKAGIVAFRDDDELPQGENIGPKLMAVITTSKILIPILSETYGTSSWCLNELVQITERKNNNGQIVLPIFYKVKPADVRHQIGSFGDAFHEHERHLQERRFDPTILEKWKKALNEVSTLRGYEANGSEAELVKLVVRKVLSELKKKFELVVSKNLVGIDNRVKDVMELMDNKSHAPLFVGIHGMGGIGKTTLAKTIYNKLSNQFEHRSFIADIRESCKRGGVHHLQDQLIYDILKQKNAACNEDEGINFISSRFKGEKVLVLLDDVDDVSQVKCLAGNHDWFSSGSRIIITARNKMILEAVGVDHNYDLRELNYNQSLILFSNHAFRMDFPPSEFEGLTREVVSTTGGLPLSLEVLGSSLCGKESKDWRDMITKLEKVPHKEVQEKLRISYNALDYGQKQIFLDIACFLIGTDRRIAFYMWDACNLFFPGENIEVLRFMSLIKIGDNHQLQMHDQLRDLGRMIVCEGNEQEPWNRSRLWDSEEAWKVLKRNKGTDKIKAINLGDFGKTVESNGDIYAKKQFKNLTSLRFLHVKEAQLSGDFKDSIEELRWLQWKGCPVNFEVKNFHVTELAVLELLDSEINEKWEGWSTFMVAKKLKYLDLTSCKSLENTMFLSAFKHLEVLILNSCWSLKQIDPSIGDMKDHLLRLELHFCESLRELPVEIGSLQNLEILDISYTDIEKLPEGIGGLRKLRELRASNCFNLKGKILESMCNISSLQRLDFGFCVKFQSLLPDLLPSSLTDLGVTCRSRKLPSLSHLTHLKQLRVQGCAFPDWVQELPSELPQSLNTPFKLEILLVDACRSIETLDVSQFVHLRRLSVINCHSIESLLLPKSKSLKELRTRRCEKLAEIQGLNGLEFLERLDIFDCTSIERLDFSKSERLKILETIGCKKLAKIQGLDKLKFLEELNIRECISIERLDLRKSERLKRLDADSCKNLAEIQGLDTLEFLEILRIGGCESLKTIPKLSGTRIIGRYGSVV